MLDSAVRVVFDRKKQAAKKGCGCLDVVVNLGKKVRKYIMVCTTTPEEWEEKSRSLDTLQVIDHCKKILTTMEILGEESTIENFNRHFFGEEEEEQKDSSNKDFIAYCEEALAAEDIKIGTRKHKQVVIDAVKTYGKLR